MVKDTFFQDKWLEIDGYKDWLAPVKGDKTEARCTKCRCNISLSNMGAGALNSHAKGNTHKQLVQRVRCFFNTRSKEKGGETTGASTLEPASSSSVPLTQQSLELTVQKSETTKAEIRFLLHSITSGHSYNSNDDVGELFKSMFPDSEIAKSFSFGRTKQSYVVSHGLGPHFKDLLKDNVNQSSCYVVSYDESLNKVNQKSEMDILIRYWDIIAKEVKVRFWSANFLGHTAHQDLLETFNDTTRDFSMAKMMQVSMDGPSVNLKLLSVLSADRERNELPGLLDIGSCSLHVIHGAFQTGARATPWGLQKILKATWQILHESPARREDYESITKSIDYPLPFCATRWVESNTVAEKAISIWPNISKVIAYWEGKVRSKQPSCKSYTTLQTAVRDPLTTVKLEFFSYVASLFLPYLLAYQTGKPMVPFMYFDLVKLHKSVMKPFVKSEVIEACKSGYELKSIDVSLGKNQIKAKDMFLGFSTEDALGKLVKQDKISNVQISKFREECLTFLVKIVEKLFERSPLGSAVVRNVRIFDPNVLVQYGQKKSQERLKNLLSNSFVVLKIITPSYAEKVFSDFDDFYQKEVKLHSEMFRKYDRTKTRLDHFYFHSGFRMEKYPHLSYILQIVFTMSHGQADVERGFSQRNLLLKQNQSDETMNYQRIIKDHMCANSLKAQSIEISNQMILSVKSARLAYERNLEEERKKKEISSKDIAMKQLICDIDKLKAGKDVLHKLVISLDEESEEHVFEAEKDPENCMLHISKSTALKRKCREKKEEIKKLEECLEVMEKKRKCGV